MISDPAGGIPFIFDGEKPEAGQDDAGTGEPIQKGFGLYLQQMGEYELLTEREEIELGKRIEGGDEKAFQEMVLRNLRLVVMNAKSFSNRRPHERDHPREQGRHPIHPEGDIKAGGEPEDLHLFPAAEKYDYRKGCRFSTFATYWIRQSIQRGLQKKKHVISVPFHLSEKMARIDKVSKQYTINHGREPSLDEISEMTGLSIKTVKDAVSAARHPVSIDKVISDEDGATIGDFISDEKESPEDSVLNRIEADHVYDLFAVLNEQEKTVITYKYGLSGLEPQTLEEIGVKIGVTRERVRQVQVSALRKMRHHLEVEERRKRRTQKTKKQRRI